MVNPSRRSPSPPIGRRFIDLGSGLPTAGDVHELAHGRALLSDETTTTEITADVREPETIFADPRTTELIDLDRPFAVIAASIPHHLGDDEAYDVAPRIRDQLAPGATR